jgi:DinB superfamily
MPIVPDTKDWTWVTERACPECGFDPDGVAPDRVGSIIRATVPRWQAALGRPDAARRTFEFVWSALEYGAHVRDVCQVFSGRLALMLAEDNPGFPNWDQDQAALDAGYAQEDPQRVARQLEANAAEVAGAFDAVPADQWERRGLRSNGSAFTVRTLGAYFVHDVVHHLNDVGA